MEHRLINMGKKPSCVCSCFNGFSNIKRLIAHINENRVADVYVHLRTKTTLVIEVSHDKDLFEIASFIEGFSLAVRSHQGIWSEGVSFRYYYKLTKKNKSLAEYIKRALSEVGVNDDVTINIHTWDEEYEAVKNAIELTQN